MSESTSTVSMASTAPKKGGGRRKLSLPVILLIVAGGLALFSLVRVISGADDTSPPSARSPARSSWPCRSASPASAVCGPSGPV
ncbi:UNVERIFIED_CONTAM: hypothetical protein RKD43_004250 [Streptomyces graminofaciens]